MLKIIFSIFMLSFSFLGCKKSKIPGNINNANLQIDGSVSPTPDPFGSVEPRQYNSFSYTNHGKNISAQVVADLHNPGHRIVIFNPGIENSGDGLSEAALNAMKNWEPRKNGNLAFRAMQQEIKSGLPVTYWSVETERYRFCALPNTPSEDGKINIIRIWWQ